MSQFPEQSAVFSTTPTRLVKWPVVYSLIFKTDIIRRQDGSEKRYSPFNIPDKRFDLNNTFIAHDAQIKSFDFDYISLTGESEIVDWTTLREVTDILYSVPYTRYYTDNVDSFSIDQEIALISDFDSFDARVCKGTVIGKGSNFVNIASVFFAQFSKFTRLASIAKVYSNQSERSQFTGQLDQAKINWVVKPGQKKLTTGILDPAVDYISYTIPYFYVGGTGFPIFDFIPDWNKEPTVNTTINNRIYGSNTFNFDNPEEATYDLWTCNYIGTRDYLRKLEYFIYQMRGRYQSFWFIPPIEQIKVISVNNVIQPAIYTAFTLGVFTVTFAQLSRDDFYHLAIGQKIINQNGKIFTIVGISNSGLTVELDSKPIGSTSFQFYESTITLSENYNYGSSYLNSKYIGMYDGTTLHLREIKSVVNNILTIYGWCPTQIFAIAPATLYRFSADEFNFNYQTHLFGTIELGFFQLPAYNPETLSDNSCKEIGGTNILGLNGTTYVGSGPGSPPFNCAVECNAIPPCRVAGNFPNCDNGFFEPISCSPMSGITGAALCACYTEEVGRCYIHDPIPDCTGTGAVSICQQFICCYTSGKEVLDMDCSYPESRCAEELLCWTACV